MKNKYNYIFDIKKTDDLTEKCKKELKLLSRKDSTKKLLDLFDKKSRLSIDEIIAALYRLHKIEKTRKWVSYTLYNLKKSNLIRKINKGTFEKIKHSHRGGR